MQSGLKLVTAPSEEPLTRSEAKLHLRLDTNETSPAVAHSDDTIVDALIVAARKWAESYQGRAYITQTWDLYLDSFPDENCVKIPLPPLQSVQSIIYKDSAGVAQTVSFLDPSGTAQLETTDYLVDISSAWAGKLYLKYGKSWPSTYAEAQAVIIRFICGYGAAEEVPEDVKTAMLMKISDLYENRGDGANSSGGAVKSLLDSDRILPI